MAENPCNVVMLFGCGPAADFAARRLLVAFALHEGVDPCCVAGACAAGQSADCGLSSGLWFVTEGGCVSSNSANPASSSVQDGGFEFVDECSNDSTYGE